KYRRPADLVTADYQEPERTRLLWVYEGLTHYLTVVLATRSGLWSPEVARDFLGTIAEEMNNQRGRAWRPLEDTTVGAFIRADSAGWDSWRRGGDYYDEGVLLWLEADTLIREQTRGQKSLDDFCRRFLGGDSGGGPEVKPYTFDDLAAALN